MEMKKGGETYLHKIVRNFSCHDANENSVKTYCDYILITIWCSRPNSGQNIV